MKSISFFHKFYIIIYSIYLTAKISLTAIFSSWFLRDSISICSQTMYQWSYKILKLVKLHYTVFYHTHFSFLPGKPYIIMSNHTSLYDIPIIYITFPNINIRMIAKKELFKIPIWGQGLHAAGFMCIDRSNQKKSLQTIQEAKIKADQGIIFWISPEGTRSKNDQLLPFKSGGFRLALELGAQIIPVGIQGANKILPPKSTNFSLNEKIKIHVGEPIDASRYHAKEDKKLLVADVRKAIENLLRRD